MTGVAEMLGVEQLSAILIILPFLAAIVCYMIRVSGIRSIVILITGGVLIRSTLSLIPLTPFSLSPPPFFGINIHAIVQALDFLLLLIILYFGFKHRHIIIKGLTLLQIILNWALSDRPHAPAELLKTCACWDILRSTSWTLSRWWKPTATAMPAASFAFAKSCRVSTSSDRRFRLYRKEKCESKLREDPKGNLSHGSNSPEANYFIISRPTAAKI